MKKKFKCHSCGKISEFDTEDASFEVLLAESNEGIDEAQDTTTYIVICEHCNTENRVSV